MKREQAEAAADALLQPGRKEQAEFAHRAQMKSIYLQSRERKVWALLALVGLATGAVLGYFAFGAAAPSWGSQLVASSVHCCADSQAAGLRPNNSFKPTPLRGAA